MIDSKDTTFSFQVLCQGANKGEQGELPGSRSEVLSAVMQNSTAALARRNVDRASKHLSLPRTRLKS